ncbi:MAG: hypothetical protein JW816_02155 [Candidatus Buchananbacteria bacterium]|nr:hypothetical protein [Candidatus Buchananbacteria bacterium]
MPAKHISDLAEFGDNDQILEHWLLNHNLVDEKDLLVSKAALLNYPAIELVGKKLSRNIVRLMPVDLASHYQLVIFDRQGNTLSVGLVDPTDKRALEIIRLMEFESGLNFKIFVISLSSFNYAFGFYNLDFQHDWPHLLDNHVKKSAAQFYANQEKKNSQNIIKPVPASKLILVIIHHAVEGRANDIHIEPSGSSVQVRFRFNGILHPSLILPKASLGEILDELKLLAYLDNDQAVDLQVGEFNLKVGDREVKFSLATLPLKKGEKIILQLI